MVQQLTLLRLNLGIRSMVKSIEQPDKAFVRTLEKKLDQCRNQENNPNSLMWVSIWGTLIRSKSISFFLQYFRYKQRMQKMMEDEDDIELGLSTSYHLNVSEEINDTSMLSVE